MTTCSQTLRENPAEHDMIAELLDVPITNGKTSSYARELDEDPTIIESLSKGLELQLHWSRKEDRLHEKGQDRIPSRQTILENCDQYISS